MPIALARVPDGVRATRLSDDAEVLDVHEVRGSALLDFVRREEEGHPRWVWDSTAAWYPELLAAGIRVERCVDLRLCHAILRGSEFSAGSALATADPGPWDEPVRAAAASPPDALFDLGERPMDPDPVPEYAAQLAAVRGSDESSRLALLVAAESAGALVAAELRHAGLPWDAGRHSALLDELLGPRPATGRPARLSEQLALVRDALDDPHLNPDSPVELLRGLQNAASGWRAPAAGS